MFICDASARDIICNRLTAASLAGRFARNSSAEDFPLAMLHVWQQTTKLLTRFVPPRLRGMIWSILYRFAFVLPQWAQCRPSQ